MIWIQQHTTLLLLLWPIVSAACSVLYTWIDRNTRGHAILQALAAAGFDLPKFLVWLQAAIQGSPPSGGSVADAPPPSTRPNIRTSGTIFPPSAARRGRMLFALLTLGALGSGVVACHPAPPTTPKDTANAVACIAGQLGNGSTPEAVSLACLGSIEQWALDVYHSIAGASQRVAAGRCASSSGDGGVR